ncbi:MAG: hypothetical protein ACFNZV_05580, partial [Rothia dentocariosa]
MGSRPVQPTAEYVLERLQEGVDHLAEVSRVEVGCSVAVLDERAHVHFQSLAVDTGGEELM